MFIISGQSAVLDKPKSLIKVSINFVFDSPDFDTNSVSSSFICSANCDNKSLYSLLVTSSASSVLTVSFVNSKLSEKELITYILSHDEILLALEELYS